MNSKILFLVFAVTFQVTLAQLPFFPNPLGTAMTPPFVGSFNTNWARPFYTAAADGWRTYFEHLQQARNQIFPTLTNGPSKNVELQPPAIELPPHHEIHETQVVTTVKRPQVQSDVQHVLPQGQVDVQHSRPQGQLSVTHVTQAKPPTLGLPGITSGTRPISSPVSSGSAQTGSQILPQIGSQIPGWIGK